MIIKGTAYIQGDYENCYIGIEEGKIDFVKKSLKTTEEVKKLEGVILPAGTDLHVHFRDPGMTEKEDFYTGSVSAACGGITTVMDMPNTEPPTDSYSRLKEKIKIGEKKSVIDFGLYGLLSDDVKKMSELTDFFKVYMAPSTGAESLEEEELADLLRKAGSNNCSVAFHCEDRELFNETSEQNLTGYNEHRPLKSELKAVESLKDMPGKDKYICHLTSEGSLKRAKRNDYTSEVTPHHLLLSVEAFLGPYGKVNPPLRKDTERYRLWEAFERDEIDIVSSDHAPHLEEEKEDFEEAPSGVPGVETLYPLLLNKVARGKISMSTVIESIALNPAERLGIKKGRIEEGYRADLITIDFRDSEAIQSENLHHKCGWTPFEGFQGIFPKTVMSKGEFIVDDKQFLGEKGRGEYLKRRKNI
ncbi:MAG: dihydroorotase [Candidatus Thermoplasmatota archaeon]